MTRFAKILVVFVAAASLGFAAFALAMFAGGPNWEALANDPAIRDKVAFSHSDTGTYSATMRVSGEQVASSQIQADVVLKAQQRVLSEMRTELQDIQARVATLTPQRQVVHDLVAVDLQGLQKHASLWATQLEQLSQQIAKMTDELGVTGAQALKLQEELKELRFEVLRLRNQLELLRDDLFVAETQRSALENELLLLEQNRQRLERRQEQLKQQLGSSTP